MLTLGIRRKAQRKIRIPLQHDEITFNSSEAGMSHFIEDALRDRRIESFAMERAQIEIFKKDSFIKR